MDTVRNTFCFFMEKRIVKLPEQRIGSSFIFIALDNTCRKQYNSTMHVLSCKYNRKENCVCMIL